MYIRKSVCGLCKPHKKVVKNKTKYKRRLEKELAEDIEQLSKKGVLTFSP